MHSLSERKQLMTDEQNSDERKRLRAAENLGWLAESGTSYSKKRRLIEGIKRCSMALGREAC